VTISVCRSGALSKLKCIFVKDGASRRCIARVHGTKAVTKAFQNRKERRWHIELSGREPKLRRQFFEFIDSTSAR